MDELRHATDCRCHVGAEMVALARIVPDRLLGEQITEEFRNGSRFIFATRTTGANPLPPPNALLLALDQSDRVIAWDADLVGLTLIGFAATAPRNATKVQVWAWQKEGEFELAQAYELRRLPLGPQVTGGLLDPPLPPSLRVFRVNVPAIRR